MQPTKIKGGYMPIEIFEIRGFQIHLLKAVDYLAKMRRKHRAQEPKM